MKTDTDIILFDEASAIKRAIDIYRAHAMGRMSKPTARDDQDASGARAARARRARHPRTHTL